MTFFSSLSSWNFFVSSKWAIKEWGLHELMHNSNKMSLCLAASQNAMFDYSGFKTALKEVIFWSNYVSDNSEKRLQWAQKRDDSFAAALRLLEQTKNQFLHRHCSKPTFLAKNSTSKKWKDLNYHSKISQKIFWKFYLKI